MRVTESREDGSDRLGKGLHAMDKLKKGSLVGEFV